MDLSATQYNSASASESGWTHYLDQSSLPENYSERSNGIVDYEGKGARMEEEEEDLSMVSDASSGPPHYHDEVDKCYRENWYPHLSSTSQCSEKKVKECGSNQHLDDTASSPVYTCTKKKVSFSGNGAVGNALGFSAARLKKHFNFFERSLVGKQASEVPGGFDEEERK